MKLTCFGDSNIISFKDIELEVTTVLENEYNLHVQETKKKNIKDLEEYIRKEALDIEVLSVKKKS